MRKQIPRLYMSNNSSYGMFSRLILPTIHLRTESISRVIRTNRLHDSHFVHGDPHVTDRKCTLGGHLVALVKSHCPGCPISPLFLYILIYCWTCSRPEYAWNICHWTL